VPFESLSVLDVNFVVTESCWNIIPFRSKALGSGSWGMVFSSSIVVFNNGITTSVRTQSFLSFLTAPTA
jgi:hypothetical protein